MKPIYPLIQSDYTIEEKSALQLEKSAGTCPICERDVIFESWTENFRESGLCSYCNSTNRQRQIANGICNIYSESSLTAFLANNDLAIYNTESTGPLHEVFLENRKDYIFSEFHGPEYRPGENVNGVRNEDAQNLSFTDNSIDLILSSDVWEHIPEPYLAHEEVYRVLKNGGRHIFTVPFHSRGFCDDVRARLRHDGSVDFLSDPIYHHDPIRPEGVLVYTIFSIEMLSKLSVIGFHTNMHIEYAPKFGILGSNALLFEAIKL